MIRYSYCNCLVVVAVLLSWAAIASCFSVYPTPLVKKASTNYHHHDQLSFLTTKTTNSNIIDNICKISSGASHTTKKASPSFISLQSSNIDENNDSILPSKKQRKRKLLSRIYSKCRRWLYVTATLVGVSTSAVKPSVASIRQNVGYLNREKPYEKALAGLFEDEDKEIALSEYMEEHGLGGEEEVDEETRLQREREEAEWQEERRRELEEKATRSGKTVRELEEEEEASGVGEFDVDVPYVFPGPHLKKYQNIKRNPLLDLEFTAKMKGRMVVAVPFLGGLWIREIRRSRREKSNVSKGVDFYNEMRQEYFDITKASIKENEDKDEDKDDEDDEDDDDEDDDDDGEGDDVDSDGDEDDDEK